jgi:hypothetical protein
MKNNNTTGTKFYEPNMKSLGNYSISEARYEFKYNFKPNHFE